MPSRHRFTKSIILRFVTILLIIMIVPFVILLLITISETQKAERDRATEFLTSNLKIISSTTDNLLSSIETGQTELLLNTSFTKAVTNLQPYSERVEYPDFKAVQAIKRSIRGAAIKNDAIETVYLYCVEADRLFISSINWDPAYNQISLEGSGWVQSYENNTQNYPWSITSALESGKAILSCYRIIEQYQQPLTGLLSINVAPDVVLGTINKAELGAGSMAFVTDAYGNLLHDSAADAGVVACVAGNLPPASTSGTFDVSYNGESIFAAYLYSEYSGFTYVAFSPLSQIQSATARVSNLTVWYVVESILVLIICILLVYYFFFRPIRSLANGMQRFEKGDFSVKMPAERSDEIGLINRQFNEMTTNIDTLIKENYVNELAKRDIQLKSTQNQINEHFLYNTLDSIHWLAKQYNAKGIGAMINALANFYRASLSNGRDYITIGEVADMIGDYLYLQRIRFGDALRYTVDFDHDLSGISIPKHLFLPLVENAIGHGINGKADGKVSVSLKRMGGSMRFSVSDNGQGIPAHRLKEIYAHLAAQDINTEDSFALRNINTQLELYFGNSEGIQIRTGPEAGTTMWFDIPIEEGGAHND